MRTIKTIFATVALSLALSTSAVAAPNPVSAPQSASADTASMTTWISEAPVARMSTQPTGYYCYYDYVYVCNSFGCEYVYRYICI